MNGENRQELAFIARVRVSKYLSGDPLPRNDPSVVSDAGISYVLRVRKLHTLLESYGIKIDSALDIDARVAMREAIRECCDSNLTDKMIDSVFGQVVCILHQWSIPPEPNSTSFQHLSIVPPPLPPRDRLNRGEFWTYTPRDDHVYLTKIINGGIVKKPTNGLPYVEIAIHNPVTGLSCTSRMDEEDIDMYLSNGHSRESARLATKCLLCEVCLEACGYPVDQEDLLLPDHKRPLAPASTEELKHLQSTHPALMCSGCGITVHVDCLGKDRSFTDKATLHYMAAKETDWFCHSCIPPKFPRNAAHAIQFGYQYTDKLMSRKEYEKRSDQKRSEMGVTMKSCLEEIELKFWKTIANKDSDIQVLYASDLDSGDFSDGSFDKRLVCPPSWDLRRLSLSSESVLRHLPGAETITGVSRPWLYLGSFFSSFCWHSEDHFLCSISYLHEGAPKIWYTIPGEYRARMDEVMAQLLPDLYTVNRDLSHHLVTLIDPEILVKNFGIPVGRVVQNPGEFIITFPEAFHCGFNAGINLAEAVNVACPDWFINHGKKSVEHYAIMKRPSVICFDSLVWQTALAIVKGDEIRKSVGEYCVAYLTAVTKRVEKLDTKVVGGELSDDIEVCENCNQFCYFASRGDDDDFHCLDCEGSGKVSMRHPLIEIETLINKVSSRVAQYRTVRRSTRAADAALAKRTRKSEL